MFPCFWLNLSYILQLPKVYSVPMISSMISAISQVQKLQGLEYHQMSTAKIKYLCAINIFTHQDQNILCHCPSTISGQSIYCTICVIQSIELKIAILRYQQYLASHCTLHLFNMWVADHHPNVRDRQPTIFFLQQQPMRYPTPRYNIDHSWCFSCQDMEFIEFTRWRNEQRVNQASGNETSKRQAGLNGTMKIRGIFTILRKIPRISVHHRPIQAEDLLHVSNLSLPGA